MSIRTTGRVTALLAGLSASAALHAGSIWYVDDSGPGGGGTSWADASNDLALVLVGAVSGDEVRVAAGLYTPGASPSASFAVPAGVVVNGGYAGFGAPNPDLRDPINQVTHLNGDLGGGNHSQHVVMIGSGSGVVLDGLLITGGRSPNLGGGIYISGGSPSVQGCTLADNTANASYGVGGAVYSGAGTPEFIGCLFDGNTSRPGVILGGWGGAIYAGDGLVIDSCTFTNNDAYRGGAVFIGNSATITNSLFSQNTADSGGAVNRDGPGALTIDLCEFRSNTGALDGGAVLLFNTTPGCQITGSDFYGNTAAFGGGVANLSGGMSMTRCILSGNTGTTAGGGVSTNTGSGQITNCTFEGNTSPVGGGVSLTASSSTPAIRNSILWNNGGSAESNQIAVFTLGGSPSVNYSDLQGLTGGLGGTGNIGLDPLFTDVSNKDFSLQSLSPCIDAGDPSLAYNDPDGSRNDMGAVAQQNARPTAVAVCQQLTNLGPTADVLLDGSGSSDPDDADEDLYFQWYVDGGLVAEGLGTDYAVVEVSMGYGAHEVTLVVSDPGGAYDDDVKNITISAAALSLLEAGKTVVDFKAAQGNGTVSISGEVGLPYGLNYTEVARKAGIGITVGGISVANAALTLQNGCGGWGFSSQNGVGGITRVSIDWTGAKFEYKTPSLTIRSDVIRSDETVITVKYQMKKIGGPFAITFDGRATLTVNAQGVASADVPMCVDDHGKEVTLHLPYGLTDASVIAIVGPPYGLIDVGDYLSASIGRYRIEGKFNASLFPAGAATTPRKVDLSLTLGNEGYAGATTVTSADLAVKKDKWQAH